MFPIPVPLDLLQINYPYVNEDFVRTFGLKMNLSLEI